MFSCGIASTYKISNQNEENNLEKFDINYFIENRQYNKELFE